MPAAVAASPGPHRHVMGPLDPTLGSAYLFFRGSGTTRVVFPALSLYVGTGSATGT